MQKNNPFIEQSSNSLDIDVLKSEILRYFADIPATSPARYNIPYQYGDRLIMMYNGHIAVDVSGEEKKKLSVEQLLNLFSQASGSDKADDKLILG